VFRAEADQQGTVERMTPESIIVTSRPTGRQLRGCRVRDRRCEHGVKILAPLNVPADMPTHASTLFSRNLTAFLLAFHEGQGVRARPRRRHPAGI